MTKELIEVKYYYIRKTTVKVEYIDRNTGENIKEVEKQDDKIEIEKESTEIIEGHEGDFYQTEEKIFEDYVIIEKPENIQGEMKVIIDENGEVITETVVRYYYAHESAGVEEYHIDAITGELLEEKTKYEGCEGDKYKTTCKEFEGYDVVDEKMPENAEGESYAENQEMLIHAGKNY